MEWLNLNKYDLEQKIFKNISENAKFYFVHSFHCNDLDESTEIFIQIIWEINLFHQL